MVVLSLSSADAGQRLAVVFGTLPAPGIGDLGLANQITLIAGVGKNCRAERRAIVGADAPHAAALHGNAAGLPQAMAVVDMDVSFAQQVLECRLGHVRLELPLNRRPVVLSDSLEELPRDAADHFLITGAAVAEAPGDHSA